MNPRAVDTEQTRRVAAYEALRLAHGGTPQADAVVASYNQMANELRAEIPSLSTRAAMTGANLDTDIINTLARYGTAPASK